VAPTVGTIIPIANQVAPLFNLESTFCQAPIDLNNISIISSVQCMELQNRPTTLAKDNVLDRSWEPPPSPRPCTASAKLNQWTPFTHVYARPPWQRQNQRAAQCRSEGWLCEPMAEASCAAPCRHGNLPCGPSVGPSQWLGSPCISEG
jgi:hypothetical protein